MEGARPENHFLPTSGVTDHPCPIREERPLSHYRVHRVSGIDSDAKEMSFVLSADPSGLLNQKGDGGRTSGMRFEPGVPVGIENPEFLSGPREIEHEFRNPIEQTGSGIDLNFPEFVLIPEPHHRKEGSLLLHKQSGFKRSSRGQIRSK